VWRLARPLVRRRERWVSLNKRTGGGGRRRRSSSSIGGAELGPGWTGAKSASLSSLVVVVLVGGVPRRTHQTVLLWWPLCGARAQNGYIIIIIATAYLLTREAPLSRAPSLSPLLLTNSKTAAMSALWLHLRRACACTYPPGPESSLGPTTFKA
jgi:hypothetical protein